MRTKRTSQQFRRMVDVLGIERGCHSSEAEGMPPHTPAHIERILHVCREKSFDTYVFNLTQPFPSWKCWTQDLGHGHEVRPSDAGPEEEGGGAVGQSGVIRCDAGTDLSGPT